MQYTKSAPYQTEEILGRIMGPNPIKLTEELMEQNKTPRGAVVMDLGCGQGVTSLFLAREYGFITYATDLWIEATDNWQFFQQQGMENDKIIPIHADATGLPYAKAFFDAVVTVDSYHYFGRDPAYLRDALLPYVKPGGYVYIAIPGMVRDCHDDLPAELLLSWTPEQLETMHDVAYWRSIISQTGGMQIVSIGEMESNSEVWADWLKCENEYAVGDRKTMEAGGGKYLNFIAIVLQKDA